MLAQCHQLSRLYSHAASFLTNAFFGGRGFPVCLNDLGSLKSASQ